MRVLRGRAADAETDRAVTSSMLARTAETGTPAVRVWRPHRQVAFGRLDARASGYERARGAATDRGYRAVERDVGGHAVAYTGETLAFARATPIEDLRSGLGARYEAATVAVLETLRSLGVDAERGEPPESFCPGEHSVQAGGKVAGIAQRLQRGAALVAGVVVVTDRRAIADVLDPVYAALDLPFDPDSVGSVADAGGPTDPERVARALETRLTAGTETTVERVE